MARVGLISIPVYTSDSWLAFGLKLNNEQFEPTKKGSMKIKAIGKDFSTETYSRIINSHCDIDSSK